MDLPYVLSAAAMVAGFILVSSLAATPLAWKKMLRSKRTIFLAGQDEALARALMSLDDRHHVFHGMRMESVADGHVVIGPGGVYVVQKALLGEEVRIQGRRLASADAAMDARVQGILRVCRFLGLVAEKKFGLKIAPVPLFGVAGTGPGLRGLCGGVEMLSLDLLPGRIRAGSMDTLSGEFVEGFSGCLARYCGD
jgi:hypothetical protein